jgi:hypothetical protein
MFRRSSAFFSKRIRVSGFAGGSPGFFIVNGYAVYNKKAGEIAHGDFSMAFSLYLNGSPKGGPFK